VSLSEFILSNLEPILMEWEGFARTLFAPEQGVSAERLRDHAREMLIVMAKDIQTAQSAVQQQFNSSSTAVQQQFNSRTNHKGTVRAYFRFRTRPPKHMR
jgi:hypothetical protein